MNFTIPRTSAARAISAVMILLAACSGGGGGGDAPTSAQPVLTTITVTLSASSVPTGQGATATAAGFDQNGSPIAVGSVTWTSGSPSVATISSSGAITAVAPGQTQIVATAGGRSGQSTLTVTAIPVLTTLSVSIQPSTVQVGQAATATAVGLDQNGASITIGAVTWSSGTPTVASINSSGAITSLAVGQTQIIASSGGKTGQTTLTVTPVAVATVSVTPPSATLSIGGTQQLAATTLDANGNTLTGRVVTWSTSDGTKASVSTAGLVTGVAAGTATITATSEGKTGTSSITVSAVAVATVAVTPTTATLSLAATQQLTAVTKDAAGNVLTGRVVTWSTSDATKATVSSAGLVTAVAAGSATVTATSEGKSGTSAITVTSASISIASITPNTLTPGVTATIGGTGFNASVGLNAVTIDGVAASVTSATTSQLTVTVPSLPCSPTHAGTLRVTTGGLSASAAQLVRAGTSRSLAVGGSFVITAAAELACTELPAGSGRYAISVVNTAQAPTTSTPYRLRGSFSLPTAASAASRSVQPVKVASLNRAPKASLRAPALPDGVAPPAFDAAMHNRVLEVNQAIYPATLAAFEARQRRLAAARSPSSGNSAAPARPALALATVGSTRAFRVNQFTTTLNATGGCTSYKDITARAVYVGTRSVVWEDVAAPLAHTMDSYYTQVGQEFDATMYSSDATYFGDPLITDATTDNDQHLNMVFTPSIPTGLAGFVIACDLSARDVTNNPSSNFGEFFYAIVPTVAGSGFASSGTADSWLRSIRTTIVHEVKHISSIGAHLVNHASSYEESWLEEGTARHAEEIWLRNNIYHVAWKGNSSYASTLYCDVRPSFSQCAGAPFGMFTHYQTLYTYLDAPYAYSLFGRVADNDFNFYASCWSFVRWAIDRYATSESAFLSAITHSLSATGSANLVAQTGHPIDEMLGNWTLSLYLDENAAFTGNADVKFPTWNTRDIFSSMKTDFPSSYPQTFPLIPYTFVTGDFALDDSGIHGGTFQMFDMSGNAPVGQTIGLVGYQGAGTASSSLRIAIARIQ